MERFWPWFFSGADDGPRGARNVINAFLFIHVAIASGLTILISSDPFLFAQNALFPACSILIGLSLAWSTRASTILQSADLRKRLFTAERPAEDYIYSFQLSILVVIIMVAYVAVMAGGGLKIAIFGNPWDKYASAFWMYFLLSLTLRECWGVVDSTNMLSMLEYIRTK